MEGRGNPPLSATEAVMKKPRSVASRKPRSTEQLASEYNGLCAPSRNASHDDDADVEAGGHRRKELYLNSPEMKASLAHKNDVPRKLRREDRSGGDYDGPSRSSRSNEAAKRGSDGVLALECTTKSSGSSDNLLLVPRDASVHGENRLRKVKLKVGGITRTIHPKTVPEAEGSGIPATSDGSPHRHKHKDSGGYTSKDTHDISQSSDLVRKSKRIPKKKTLDGDSDDEDGELRYLEKLRGAKIAPDPMTTGHGAYDDSADDGLKKKKLSKVSKNKSTYEVDEDFTTSRFGKDGRKLQLGYGNESIEEEESEMDENNGLKEVDSPSDAKIETPGLTTRQRALQGRGGHGESLIEFPDGLPAASSRKQKEKLSEVEIQAKKAEAAQRRKMQVEKAEKEQQAEAIRKILGIDSEKKKEEKKQKEREEREKQARLEEYRKNCVRTVMGPTGTVITFPESMGLPSIFNSKPVSYPPLREKCAGPNCTNPYKYRDSKTRVPLCSLACYKAVQGRPAQGSEAAQGSSAAQGSVAAQGGDVAQGSVAAQGGDAAQGSVTAQGGDADQGSVAAAQGGDAARGSVSAQGGDADQGSVTAAQGVDAAQGSAGKQAW